MVLKVGFLILYSKENFIFLVLEEGKKSVVQSISNFLNGYGENFFIKFTIIRLKAENFPFFKLSDFESWIFELSFRSELFFFNMEKDPKPPHRPIFISINNIIYFSYRFRTHFFHINKIKYFSRIFSFNKTFTSKIRRGIQFSYRCFN